MSTTKLIGLGIAWLFAAITIAVVTAVVVTELLRIVGLVHVGESSHSIALNGVGAVVFIAMVSVPFVYRARFVDERPENSSKNDVDSTN